VDDFELETIWAAEVDRVVAARSKRELSGAVEDLCAKVADQLVDRPRKSYG